MYKTDVHRRISRLRSARARARRDHQPGVDAALTRMLGAIQSPAFILPDEPRNCVAHCGQWHPVPTIPYVLPCCGAQLGGQPFMRPPTTMDALRAYVAQQLEGSIITNRELCQRAGIQARDAYSYGQLLCAQRWLRKVSRAQYLVLAPAGRRMPREKP